MFRVIQENRNFMLTANIVISNGISSTTFLSYIRAAGWPLIHWMRCLSLLIERAYRLLFAPTSPYFFTSNSNDK